MFLKILRKYSQIASQNALPVSTTDTRGKFAIGVNDTGGKFASRCQRRRWQIATGINDTWGKFATGENNTGGKQWEQYQTTDNLKWTWRKKFIYMLTLLPEGV